MPGQGTAIMDFGVWPGSQEASIAFTDATISAGSKVAAYVMSDSTAGTHTANDHRYLALFAVFTAQATAGVGGTIHGRAPNNLVGQYKLHYVWTD